jgi:BNR repeat-like domain
MADVAMKFLATLLCVVGAFGVALQAAVLPDWAGRAPHGDPVRIAVPAPENPRFHHLAWPKAVRTADGTIVLGYLAGRKHPGENCPAVSISTDGGQTFSAPNILREFGAGHDYGASGNMALGLAHDGSVLLLAHGYSAKSNHIFGWRSTDKGRTWKPVNTSALGPNKTGSSTGTIVQLPGRKLMVTGHYRDGSEPFTRGIWQSVSDDDGLTWGEPAMINNLDAGEPVLVRHGDRLLVFIRGRGPASARQFISVSDDWGATWQTQLANLGPVLPGTTSLAHPFAMVNPAQPDELLAITFERGKAGAAQLWRGNPKTLAFKHERTLVDLPKLSRQTNDDYGYAWLLPLEARRGLMFYYHGLKGGPNSIWVMETGW